MGPDLPDLLSAWLGGEVEAARRDELLVRVRQDEVFRRAFVDEIRMLGMLRAVQTAEPRWLRIEDELGWIAAEQATQEALEKGVLRRLRSLPRRYPSGSWRWGGAAIVAVLLVAGLILAFWPGAHREAPQRHRPFPRVDTATGLAMVIKLDRVRWEPAEGPHPADGDLLAAGRLRFRSGRAILSMLSGVVLIVEGPADLELVAVDRIFCRQGRLRTRVPEGSEGFVVSGPGSAVMDLGTEFALNIESDGKARVVVIEGEVEGAVLDAAGIPQRSHRMEQDKAYEINPRSGQIALLAESERVIRPADLVAAPLALDAEYPGAVLASRPSSYWRFESMAGGATPNTIPGRPPLRANGPIRLTDASSANRCVVFPAGQPGQYLSMDGLWEPARSPGYTVELWFLSEAISHAALAGLFVPTDGKRIKHLLIAELTAQTRHTFHPPTSVRFLHRWPPDSAGGVNVFSREHYVPYRWHHLVAQVREERMELFLDGAPTGSLPVDPDHSTQTGQLLLGRLTQVPIHHWWWSRPFVGRMDEVALYDHPISAEEVRRHYQLARPRTRPE
jgi:hypothetical protein